MSRGAAVDELFIPLSNTSSSTGAHASGGEVKRRIKSSDTTSGQIQPMKSNFENEVDYELDTSDLSGIRERALKMSAGNVGRVRLLREAVHSNSNNNKNNINNNYSNNNTGYNNYIGNINSHYNVNQALESGFRNMQLNNSTYETEEGEGRLLPHRQVGDPNDMIFPMNRSSSNNIAYKHDNARGEAMIVRNMNNMGSTDHTVSEFAEYSGYGNIKNSTAAPPVATTTTLLTSATTVSKTSQ